MSVVLAWLLGILMIANGAAKILQIGPIAEEMAKVHIDGGALVAQGVLEIALAVATLLPRTRNVGLLGLLAVFMGAVGAHLGAGQGVADAAPALFSLVLAVAAFASANAVLLPAIVAGSGGVSDKRSL